MRTAKQTSIHDHINHHGQPLGLGAQLALPSVAGEIVEGYHRPETNLLRPGIKVIPHAVPVAQRLSISGAMPGGLEVLRLFIQEEYVPVRRAARRRRRTDVIGDEGAAGIESVRRGRLHAGLDPVQDGT